MTDASKSENLKNVEYNPLYDEHLKGLSGWLVIVGIGIFYSFFTNLYYILINVITNGGWRTLMQPINGLKFDDINWFPVIEVLLYFLTTILLVQLLILFFFKKKNFPKWFIGLKLVAIIIMFLDAYLVFYEISYNKDLREQAIYNSATTVIGALIWIPYMLISRSVRYTFIN